MITKAVIIKYPSADAAPEIQPFETVEAAQEAYPTTADCVYCEMWTSKGGRIRSKPSSVKATKSTPKKK